MLRTLIWGGGIMLALLAGNAIAGACEALEDALDRKTVPPGPPQPARVRVVILVPVGEAPEGEAAA